MGLQRPRVAPQAVKSSPGVFTLWPCPEKIPKRARPGILFPSKFPMEKEPPLLGRRREGQGQDLLSPWLKFPQSEWRALRSGVGWEGMVSGASRAQAPRRAHDSGAGTAPWLWRSRHSAGCL